MQDSEKRSDPNVLALSDPFSFRNDQGFCTQLRSPHLDEPLSRLDDEPQKQITMTSSSAAGYEFAPYLFGAITTRWMSLNGKLQRNEGGEPAVTRI